MGHVFLGMVLGLVSAIGCALAGQISWSEAVLIYWIVGSAAPVLHVLLMSEKAQEA